MDLNLLLPSVATSASAVVVAYLVARRFQKLGGNEAQERVNQIRAELDDVMTEKVRYLEEQFAGCKTRLIEVEAELKRVRAERIDLKQEIGDLHIELREMRNTQPERKVRQRRPAVGPSSAGEFHDLE